MSTINVNRPDAGAEVLQLRHSLLDYMAGNRFRPSATLTPSEVAALWFNRSGNTTTPGRVFDPDMNDGITPPPQNR